MLHLLQPTFTVLLRMDGAKFARILGLMAFGYSYVCLSDVIDIYIFVVYGVGLIPKASLDSTTRKESNRVLEVHIRFLLFGYCALLCTRIEPNLSLVPHDFPVRVLQLCRCSFPWTEQKTRQPVWTLPRTSSVCFGCTFYFPVASMFVIFCS